MFIEGCSPRVEWSIPGIRSIIAVLHNQMVAVLVIMVLGQWKYLYGLNLRPVKGIGAYYHMQNSFIEYLHLSVPDEAIARPPHILDSWSLIDPGITWLTSFIKDWWMFLPEGGWPPGPCMQERVSTNWLLKVLRLHSSQHNGQTMVELSGTQWALIRRAHLSQKRWCIAASTSVESQFTMVSSMQASPCRASISRIQGLFFS